MITRALADEPLPAYGDGKNIRDWLYVEDHAAALWRVLTGGTIGEVYNIGGESERENMDVVRTILRALDKPESLISFVTDRPGHDRRYAMNIAKLRTELQWRPEHDFDDAIAATVEWYVTNRVWWARVSTEEYKRTNQRYFASARNPKGSADGSES